MIKMFRYIKRWNKWRALSLSSPIHKILVLIGLRQDLTFGWVPTDEEEKQIIEAIKKVEKDY